MPKAQRDLDQSRGKTSETASQREGLDVYGKDRATRDREWSAASAKQAQAANIGPGEKAQLAGKSNLTGKGGPQAQRLKSPANLEEAHPYTGKSSWSPSRRKRVAHREAGNRKVTHSGLEKGRPQRCIPVWAGRSPLTTTCRSC